MSRVFFISGKVRTALLLSTVSVYTEIRPPGADCIRASKRSAPAITRIRKRRDIFMSTNTDKQNSKGGTGCLVFLIVIAAMIGIAVFGPFRDKIAEKRAEAEGLYVPGKTDLHELLGEYLDEDTYIIEAHYEGIEEDIENFEDSSSDWTEEDLRTWAEYKLEQEYVRKEMEKALLNMEDQICIVGVVGGGSASYSNGELAGFDNGYFRSLPYSTFWMKDYEGLSITLRTRDDSEDDRGIEFCYIYNFEYYPVTSQEIEDMKNSIDREADSIIACIPGDADLWLKSKVIHDELIRRLEYDFDESDHCHDLYGALANHLTVCEGYALAFQYVLKRTGEYCEVVVSDWDKITDTNHAWNKISAPSYEEYIDVTWDDTDYTDMNGNAIIKYDFFCLTEEEIAKVDDHHFDSRSSSSMADPLPYNYYRHEGYMLSSFDPAAVEDAFRRQYESGSNLLSVRFDNEEAYQTALDWLADGNNFWGVMNNVGYTDESWILTNDSLYIYSLGLGALPADAD